MKNIFYLTLIFVLLSCGLSKKKSVDKSFVKVEIKALSFKPHCGGMAPTKEQEHGTYEAIINEEYALYTINGSRIRDKKKIVFKFDDLGIANFLIEPGVYAFISTDKLLPLTELKKKYFINDQMHYKNGSDSCFELWKSKNDLILHITKDTVFTYVQQRKCWTGNNPCLEYTGPAAP